MSDLESLRLENAELTNTVEPVMFEAENLRQQVEELTEELAAKENPNAQRGGDEWTTEWANDEEWSMPKTPTAGTDCTWGDKSEGHPAGSEKGEGGVEENGNEESENGGEEDATEEFGDAREESGNDDNNDDANGGGRYDQWGIERDQWRNDPRDNGLDDEEYYDGEDEQWAAPYTESTFCRRLKMLSPQQITLPRIGQIEDFDNWDRSLRDICKYLGITHALDGGFMSWLSDDEHDWLEFLVSQSLSNQIKRMLETEGAVSVQTQYACLKGKLPEKRRLRRCQLMAQLDKLSHATSGDNAPEYLEQFLSIRDKLMSLGEEEKVPESMIFGRFYNGLRGQAFTYVVQYQMYQSMKGEAPTVLSFANYAGHLLHGSVGVPPQGYY